MLFYTSGTLLILLHHFESDYRRINILYKLHWRESYNSTWITEVNIFHYDGSL